MKHQQGTDLINQLFTTSSLLLFSLHLAEGKSFPESETQFGGKFGIPSIGGPLNLRSSKSNSNCRFRFLVHPMLSRDTLKLAVPLDGCSEEPCNILDLLASNKEFTTLVSLVKSADLVELLSKVFCPLFYT